MEDQAKKLKNEYLRNWRKTNKKKTKQYNERYWEKKSQESQEQGK